MKNLDKRLRISISDAELMALATDKVYSLVDMLHDKHQDVEYKINVIFTNRPDSIAGISLRPDVIKLGDKFMVYGYISFNMKYLIANTEYFIREIVPHEIAHVVQKFLYPKSESHGPEFVKISKELGSNGEAFHTMKLE